ncbi:inner membrane protein YbjM [Acerihabitans sp. TG2]|uniref:inner membrane protein YbjM n=1 Tax=Acerihabitans sp. TG2 TaxID=3096008 RepID=UPI002B22B323|nr:inner membrane protein YbjM [Acerihabitans sp. TG2]MEA9390605.1 inner membrane protein YbjM [Acerihabitans sp. TG2]
MAVYLRRVGSISSAILFTVVFASQESGLVLTDEPSHGASLGLLLFLLPGMVGSLLSHTHKIAMPLLGALLVTPLCLALFYLGRCPPITLWFQVTYLLSALFWCACGALAGYFFCAVAKPSLR